MIDKLDEPDFNSKAQNVAIFVIVTAVLAIVAVIAVVLYLVVKSFG